MKSAHTKYFLSFELVQIGDHIYYEVCLISPGTDLPGEWGLLALGSFPGLLRKTLQMGAICIVNVVSDLL